MIVNEKVIQNIQIANIFWLPLGFNNGENIQTIWLWVKPQSKTSDVNCFFMGDL